MSVMREDILGATSDDGGAVVSDAPVIANGDYGHFGDFDGDGVDDILWRNTDGSVATWKMDHLDATANFLPGVGNDWHIVGEPDLFFDGSADIMWRNDDKSLLFWEMASSSSVQGTLPGGLSAARETPLGYGNLDGDHVADFLFRDSSTGAITLNTGFNQTNTISLGLDWSVVGVGDYDGDGIVDLMFRNASQGINAAWLLQTDLAIRSAVFYPGVPNSWHVVGNGDFNGDGKTDLFWHNDDGSNAVWLMGNGGNIGTSGFFSGVSADWHVVGTGDFDGDHKDDVLWRNDNGATAIWKMDGVNTPSVSFPGGVPTEWQTQAPHYDYV